MYYEERQISIFVWLSAFATAAFECVKRYTLFLTGMIVYIKINVAGVV